MMQIVRIETLTIGKFLNGFFVTVVQTGGVKMINETVPNYCLAFYSPIITSCMSIGYLLCFGLGKWLP